MGNVHYEQQPSFFHPCQQTPFIYETLYVHGWSCLESNIHKPQMETVFYFEIDTIKICLLVLSKRVALVVYQNEKVSFVSL